MIFKERGTSLLAVAALALGIGLTAAMFSIVNGVVLRGLPFESSEQLVVLNSIAAGDGGGTLGGSVGVALHDFLDWRARQTSFGDLAAFELRPANIAVGNGAPERYQGVWQTPNTLRLLREQPAIGRDFRDEEGRPGAEPVAIISDNIWRSAFGARRDIIGQLLRVNGTSATVIGVMPRGFAFPVTQDVWLPLTSGDGMTRASSPRVQVIGRLAAGSTVDEAQTELAQIALQLAAEHPETNRGVGISVRPYIESFLGAETVAALMVMLVAVFGVLAIACANVTTIIAARIVERGKEIALRSAMGATRGRIVRQIVTEVFVLAMLGVGAGLVVAQLGLSMFNRAIVDTNPPFWIDIRVDATVLIFAIATAVLAAALAALVPALRASRADVATVLKDEGRSTGIRMGRFSKGVVIAELALSYALLVTSALAIQTVINLASVDFGFPLRDVWTARVTLPAEDYPDTDSRQQLQDRLLQRVGNLPGVVSAALATDVAPYAPIQRVRIRGATYASPRDYPPARGSFITPDYFAVLRSTPLRGRLFDRRDTSSGAPVAIVNESFERTFFPAGALGQQIALPSESEQELRTIVGVVPDLGIGAIDDDDPGNNGRVREAFYVPLAQSPAVAFRIVLHGTGDPLALTPLVRDAVRAEDPNLPIGEPQTLNELKDNGIWGYRIFGAVFVAFGVAALFLALVGLYGVIAFGVAKRTSEFGVRMAVGATPFEVLSLVLRQAVSQIGVGLSMGSVLAFVLASAMSMLFFGVSARDPLVYAAVGALLAATGVLASIVPARRAARVDPVVALRAR